MYYPADMTREDIVAFELDMAELTIREEYDPVNWILDEICQDIRDEEIAATIYA